MEREKQDGQLEWSQVSRRVLLDTVVFTVTERHSKGPGGIEGDYIVNEARDWAIVIAQDGDEFLMVRQWRHGEGALSIEFPGGVVEPGEPPEAAAQRELLEETGCTAGDLAHLGTLNPNPALFANHVHVYLATGLAATGKQSLDADEFVRCLRLTKHELLALPGTAEFSHALMASALCLYLTRGGR